MFSGCERNQVKIYQTLNAKRTKNKLLTQDEKILLRKLCETPDHQTLSVHAINVAPQNETECGAICVALGEICIKIKNGFS